MSSDRRRRELRFWAPDVATDVDDELAYHLELCEHDFAARGLSRAEARERAIQKFGDPRRVAAICREIDRRRYRDERRASMWMDLRQDLAYGLRLLQRAPGFTAVAVMTLALGIGATTAIFSVIDAALLRPLPYPDAEQMVQLQLDVPQADGRIVSLAPSAEDVDAWREHREIFSHVAVWRRLFPPVVVDGPEAERVAGMLISEDYLGLHGVTPLLGRGIDAGDMRDGAEPVILLGYRYWQSRFGGDADVLGQVIRVEGVPATIVGVLPPAFYRDAAIWRPLRLTSIMAGRRGIGTTVYARLRPGVFLEHAQRRISELVVARDAAEDHFQRASGIQIHSLYERTTAGYWTTARILAAAVGAILLIACINVAGLLLARGTARHAELAVRAALGAGRMRIVRQLLTESVGLSLLGAVAGALLAWITLDALVASLPLSLPPNSPPAINLRVLAFALAVAAVTGTLVGLVPALDLSRRSVASALSHASRWRGSALSRRSGQMLIAGEVALAIVLLAGAGLMIRSFSRILAVDVGFDPTRVVTMEVVPVNRDPEIARQYYPALVEALQQHPGIDAAGAVDHLPLAGSSTMTRGRVGDQPVSLNVREFVPGYFEALGFARQSGRLPSSVDLSSALPPAVVNTSAAQQMFSGRSAIGETFEVYERTYQVIGVVGDIRHRGPLVEIAPEVFIPFGVGRPSESNFVIHPIVVVRSRLAARDLYPLLRDAAAAPGHRVIIERIRQGSEWFDERVATPWQRTVLLALLGSLGLILALVGIFSTTAYAVGRRTQEIGVRMALGARPRQVVAAVLRDALWPTLAGIVLGLGAAMLATRVIATFLFDTPPTDSGTFAAVAVTMAVAAAAAAWIPARRAAAVDPVHALRAEC